ncbi:LysM peptidoglycan-binding domain-containing protein [Pseudodonghicola flavimaris]|uniref:LysM peptidoglycan-binding domain-containing protein n=1 Tax=Pseudodonghicola flavimaris TaxID=3050036 RepID=A0ABT7F7D6_9RHOB|nr:LysM peptidoglycan-binding domain-containing protein [Pseudodonghicola flavimaris]MDK3020521.1 LysM peptidoglycan-binding domain-containing protein [Pseudodonghicola flavimaris]
MATETGSWGLTGILGLGGAVVVAGAVGLYYYVNVAGQGTETAPAVIQPAPVTPAPAPEAEAVRPAGENTAAPAAEAAPTTPPKTTSDTVPATVPATAADTTAGTAPAPTAEPADATMAPPRFDLVRVEADGTAVIAGQALPQSRVTLLLDGVEQDGLTVGPEGEFVHFLTLPPSEAPRVLRLKAVLGEAEVFSDDEIILAPVLAPVAAPVVAEATSSAGEAEAVVAGTPAATGDSQGRAPAPATDAPVAPAPARSETAMAPATTDVGTQAPAPVGGTPAPEATSAPAPVAVLRSDAGGVELIQPASAPRPDALQALSLDLIGYSAEGEVTLSGRAGGQALVRVYLDNRAVEDLQAAGDGRWSGNLTGIAPGVYTLRLDELDDTGAVVSRLETPFKREAPEALAAAPGPAAGAAEVPPVRAVTVQKGDTLWAISRARYGEGVLYVRVFEANRDRIRNPDLIYPGQVFSIPE